ncbi:MAG: hypothetical protein QE271_07525 [Bacteriovoracaceae bacterium]|nr:hypothetical protein [Bacteriovoracaceae bacterium]
MFIQFPVFLFSIFVILAAIVSSCSTSKVAKKEKGIFETFLDENKHNAHYLDSIPVNKNNGTNSCENLKWDTPLSVARDHLEQELKKFKVDYDSLYQSYLSAFLRCPKSSFHLNVFGTWVLKLQIHQMKSKHKWKLPFTKSELLQSYKKSLAYEYWIAVNTLDYMYKEHKLQEMNFILKDIVDVIPKEKLDDRDFILNLKLTNQVIKESIMIEWNKLNEIEKNIIVNFKFEIKDLPSHLAFYCASKKYREIQDLKVSKKLIPNDILENIYGEKYFYTLRPNFCKDLNLKNLKEFNESLNQIY